MLAVIDQSGVKVGNRIYPRIARDEEPGLPPDFVRLKNDLLQQFPLEGDKPQMFERFGGCVNKIQKMHVDLGNLLARASEAAGYDETNVIDRGGGAIPFLPVNVDVSPAMIWAEPDPTRRREKLREGLERVIDAYLHEWAETLDDMVEAKHIGLVQEVGQGAYRYCWYETRTTDETISSRQRGRTVDQVVRTSRIITGHGHEVVNATIVPCVGIECPYRFSMLFGAVTDDIRPCLRVIKGMLAKKIQAEQEVDIHVRARTYTIPEPQTSMRWDPDPALVIGGQWCLAGWEDSELEALKRGHEESQRLYRESEKETARQMTRHLADLKREWPDRYYRETTEGRAEKAALDKAAQERFSMAVLSTLAVVVTVIVFFIVRAVH